MSADQFDVFPQNNLGKDSSEWARSMQNIARQNYYLLENLRTASAGNNRATSGQMGALGRQIDELQSRATYSIGRGSALSVTATSGTSFASATWSVTLPGLSSPRSALITLQSPLVVGADASAFLDSYSGSSTFVAVRLPIDDTSSPMPSGWQNNLSESFVAVIPASGLQITTRVRAVSFAGSSTASLTSPVYTYTLFDRVN